MEVMILSNIFKTLGDPARLRLLQLLATAELTVGELVRVLELPQSTVSRHLKTLKEGALVADRPVGAATYYRAVLDSAAGNGGATVREAVGRLVAEEGLAPADRARLDRVLALREKDAGAFFDKIGLRWDALREDCFGPAFHLEAFLHLLPREWTVADLGTGTGYLLPPLARHFRRVIGVDMSGPMLDLARQRLRGEGLRNVELRQGMLEQLPLAAGETDLAVAILMLHHLADIGAALRDVHRILKSGGRLLIVEIHPYDNERFRLAMADRRGGIEAAVLKTLLQQAGFVIVESWEYPNQDRPEHELAPLPGIYGCIGDLMVNNDQHSYAKIAMMPQRTAKKFSRSLHGKVDDG
ncbi:MAG: metalloregulator ArsR/SmtB family transcription factor [bacterium]|nr:metalloregulator ArsR/SmtB family transcription factor [bacterium]